MNKLGNIFNMDKTDVQLNITTKIFVAKKGSKNIAVTNSGEKNETIITAISC